MSAKRGRGDFPKLTNAFELLEAIHIACHTEGKTEDHTEEQIDTDAIFSLCHRCNQQAVLALHTFPGGYHCIGCFLKDASGQTFTFVQSKHMILMKCSNYRAAVTSLALTMEQLAFILYSHDQSKLAYFPPLVASDNEPKLLLRACMMAVAPGRNIALRHYWRGIDYQASYMALCAFQRCSNQAIYRFTNNDDDQYLILISDTGFTDVPPAFGDQRAYIRFCHRPDAFVTSVQHPQDLSDVAFQRAVQGADNLKVLDDRELRVALEMLEGIRAERKQLDSVIARKKAKRVK